MDGLWDRLDFSSGVARLRPDGTSCEEIVASLEQGRSPAEVARERSLAPSDILTAIAHAALGQDGPESPSLVQSPPRRPRLGPALEEPALAALLPGTTRPARLALAAGLLQVHDFWEASHEAAQAADDLGEHAASAYWHGIAHRREPDAGNASYWFRRVGRHPVFDTLTLQAEPLVREHGDPRLGARLVGDRGWDPSAFIELCTRSREGTPASELARRLQRLEMIALLDHTLASTGAGR